MFTEERKFIPIQRVILLDQGVLESQLKDLYDVKPKAVFGTDREYSSALPITVCRTIVPRFVFGRGGIQETVPQDNYAVRIGDKTVAYISVLKDSPIEDVIQRFVGEIKQHAVTVDASVRKYLTGVTDAYHELNGSVEMGTQVRRRAGGLSIDLFGMTLGKADLDLNNFTPRQQMTLGGALEQVVPKTVFHNALALVNTLEAKWLAHHGYRVDTLICIEYRRGGTKIKIIIGDPKNSPIYVHFNSCALFDKDTLIPIPTFNSVLNDFT